MHNSIVDLTNKYVMNTYKRLPVVFVKGKGCWLWDTEGKKYLDFLSGIAVNNLGHGYPRVIYALARQISKLIHVSNLYHIEPQAELARLLCENSFADKVFFCNSGAEANEAAVKLARKYAATIRGIKSPEVITFDGSFHGRTIAMIYATGQKKFREGFAPDVPGFVTVPFGDISEVKKVVGPNTCAVMVEPIQGEGGVIFPPEGFLKDLRDLCSEKKVLLIFDEVQVGMGRTGDLFAYESLGITPDIMTLAKGLGSGIPIGAMLARDFAADAFKPGDHASTFGGNPLATSAGIATVKALLEEKILENCREQSAYLGKKLRELKKEYDIIKDVRGKGLIWGIELGREVKNLVQLALEERLIINCIKDKVIRILPPLVIKRSELMEGVAILERILGKL